MLTGCSKINNVPNEEKFLQDYSLKNTDMTYDSCKTYNKVLLKKENRFIADVDFFKKDEYANYEARIKFTYKFSENSGWILDDFMTTDEEVNCFKGRSFEEIEKNIAENYKTYISGCTKATVKEVPDVTSGRTQKVKVECEILKGNVTSSYNDAVIEFKYGNGKWRFDNTALGSVNNYYMNLKGSQWKYEDYGESPKPKGYYDIEITDVSKDSKTINFKYGNTDYTATLAEDYSAFEKGYVKYSVNKEFYIGKEQYNKNPKELYVKEIEFPTFKENGFSLIVTAFHTEYSKWNYEPTQSIFYELK